MFPKLTLPTRTLRPRLPVAAALLTAALAADLTTYAAVLAPRARSAGPDSGVKTRATHTLASLPLLFEANAGQSDSRVKFLARGPGYAAFLTADETVLALRAGCKPAKGPGPTRESMLHSAPQASTAPGAVLRTRMLGANPHPTTVGEQPVAVKATYLKGNDPTKWRAATQYQRVRAKEVYPGIDLVHYGNQSGKLEYDFVVQPGADPRTIRFTVAGAEKAVIEPATGDLVLRTGSGEVRQQRPVVYQERGGRQVPVSGAFVLAAGGAGISFAVGPYDRTRPLVIDPTLVYSTYLGGAEGDGATAVAAEGNGIVYVAGYTDSTDFPVGGGYQTNSSGPDAFLMKLDTTQSGATSLLYSTYLGGNGYDGEQLGVTAEGNGIAYLCGVTVSTDFPVVGQYQGYQGQIDGFLTKLDTNRAGAASLRYSTYLGGTTTDKAWSVAAEGNGIVYVSGTTDSPEFPVLGQYQGYQRDYDGFLTKLDTTRTGNASLLYSTCLGGNSLDSADVVAAEGNGIVYVAGQTFSSNFPVQGEYQRNLPGSDVFLTKLDTTQIGAASLRYSTYLGGSDSNNEYATGLAAEGNGIVYLAGGTRSADFPVLGEYQSHQGEEDAFLAKLDTTQTGAASLRYSTCLGGSGGEASGGLTAAGNGIVYMAGVTGSADFPVLEAYQADQPGYDAFLGKLDTTQAGAASLLFCTYLGGSGHDWAAGVAADPQGIVYVAGRTDSPDFPVLGQLQGDQPGFDAFLTVFRFGAPSPPPAAPSDLTVAATSPTEIELGWTDHADTEAGFRIERKQGTASFSQVGTVAADTVAYTDGTLSSNTAYTYRVRAYNVGGNSAYSNEASGTTPRAVPTAPDGLTAVTVSDAAIALAWQDHSDGADAEDGFKIERKKGSGSFAQIDTVPANTTSYASTGLTASTRSTYRVRAYNTTGNSAYSGEATATTRSGRPAPPTGLTAGAVSQTEIDLSWQDESDNEDGFELQRSKDGGTSWAALVKTGGDVTSFEDRGVTAGKSYSYRVRAFNSKGASEWEGPVSATTPLDPPSAPSGLQVTPVSISQLDLSWRDNSTNETGFKVEKKGTDGRFSEIGSVGAGVVTYSDRNLKSNTSYTYRVKAYNSGGGTYSSEASGRTLPNLPAAPTELAATVVSQTEIDLSWKDNSTNETGFELERSTDGGTTFAPLATTAAGAITYPNPGLTANTSYSYRVRAVNGDGPSAWAGPVSATTLPNLPAAPTGLKAKVLSESAIQLIWKHSGVDADGFRVEAKSRATVTFQVVTSTPKEARGYTDQGLTPNTTYTFRVKAFNRAGESLPSSEVKGTTLKKLGGTLVVSPGKVSFGAVKVKGKKLALLSLMNGSKTERLQVSVGKPKAPFSLQTGVAPTILAPGGNLSVRLLFSPKKKGSAKGTLPITSSDPKRRKLNLALNGIGK